MLAVSIKLVSPSYLMQYNQLKPTVIPADPQGQNVTITKDNIEAALSNLFAGAVWGGMYNRDIGIYSDIWLALARSILQ
jgi:hypothetical protein